MLSDASLTEAWHELPEAAVGDISDAAHALVALKETSRTQYSWRRSLGLQLLSMVEGRNVVDFSGGGYTADFVKWPTTLDGRDFAGQTRNEARRYSETQVAKIAARDAPKPALVVSDGNWELKRKAEINTRLLEAEYDQRQGRYANVHALGHQALALSFITGTIALKVFPYPKEKRIIIELHDTLEMFLDDSDLTYGPPMTYGEVTWFNPHRLAKLEDESLKERILAAGEEKKTSLHPGPNQTLLVPVFEGWYMATADSPGRYLRCLRDGTVLEDKPYKRDEPPFVFLSPVPAQYGFWGIPWLAIAYNEMVAVNEILSAMDEAHARTAKRLVLVQENQEELAEELEDTKLVQVIKVPNVELVKELNPQPFNRIDLELLAEHSRGIADSLGVAESISAARKEPGLPSGAAQRESVAKYDDRQARFHRDYTQFIAVDLGRHILEAQRELYKATKNLKRRWQGEFFAKDIDAKDIIDLDLEAMHLQVKAISEKKGTPEERVQLAEELLAKQAITMEAYLGVLEHYDTPGETRVSKTQRRWIAWQMDRWLFADESEFNTPNFWKGPRPWFRKVDAMVQVMDGLMAAEIDEVPDDRLQFFLDFVAELSAMITAETPPPVQGPGGMNAPANPLSPIPGAGPVPGQQPPGGNSGPQANQGAGQPSPKSGPPAR